MTQPSSQPQANPYSHHIFLFPFKWDVLPLGKSFAEQYFDKRIDLTAFIKYLTDESFFLIGDQQSAADSGIELRWKSCQYNFGTTEKAPYNYSEYTYFYDFVQQALYDVEGQAHESVRYFELGLASSVTDDLTEPIQPFLNTELLLTKQYWDRDKAVLAEETFQLKLTSINLHAFSTGVGVLSFFAENYAHPDPKAILIINQLVRRIYPEFLETKPETPLLQETRLAGMLAKEVKFRFDQQAAIFCYEEYADPENLRQQTRRLPRRIHRFFPTKTFSDNADLTSTHIPDRDVVLLRNVMDDRMFILCWYGNNQLSRILRRFDSYTNEYDYESSPFWFSFISADNPGSPTVQHHKLLRQYIEQFTYVRWANYGTLYGVTRETFIILSESVENLVKVNAPPVYQHLQQMYYQMVILCLVQRASVLRFTGEITPLARMMVRNKESDNTDQNGDLAKQVNIVYRHYIDFLNRLYLREITAQIQGDELYNQLQTQMELKTDVDNLGKQLNELNTYIDGQQRKREEIQRKKEELLSKELNKETHQLNKTINWLAPLSIISGLLSFIGVERVIGSGKIQPDILKSSILYIIFLLATLAVSPFIIQILGRYVDLFKNKK